jgi:hypothetical protein
MGVPDFLTRYYTKGDYPFLSLNELPLKEANWVKNKHCKRNEIGFFYAEDDYLVQRRKVEKWIYSQLVAKGGQPRGTVPVYMVLGESPKGEYDIRADIQKDACEFRILIEILDMKAVSFTYPDSMYELEYDSSGNVVDGRRTNTPKVYIYAEIPELIKHYNIYTNYSHYIEVQVWDKKLLREIWEKSKHKVQNC